MQKRSIGHSKSGHGPSLAPGTSLNRVALSATVHCLTGCAIGEVLGMVIGTALAWTNAATIALSVVLAFFFGYALTMIPLHSQWHRLQVCDEAGLCCRHGIDRDHGIRGAIMLVIPGAMDAGLGSLLFWGSLASSLVVAGAVAFPVNRWMIARGRGHSVVHRHHA